MVIMMTMMMVMMMLTMMSMTMMMMMMMMVLTPASFPCSASVMKSWAEFPLSTPPAFTWPTARW
jgi:hypothetical protein